MDLRGGKGDTELSEGQSPALKLDVHLTKCCEESIHLKIHKFQFNPIRCMSDGQFILIHESCLYPSPDAAADW